MEPDRDFLHARVTIPNASLGNDRGEKLYVLDVDSSPDTSSCVGSCGKTWSPFVAAPDAKPLAGWSVIARADGVRQWAYQHKPLYRPADGVEPRIPDNGVDPGHSTNVSDPVPAPPPKPDWQVALFTPEAAVALPLGFGLQNINEAGGYGLVDRNGMTIYAFLGEARDDRQACFGESCETQWKPMVASELAHGVGDFSLVIRADGSRQWAYKNQPLYTFDGDLVPGAAAGRDVDKRWHVALLFNYFVPADVRFVTGLHGVSLATRSGHTLYTRNVFIFQGGGFDIYNGLLRPYSKGKRLGARGCDDECLAKWRPFLAPADAAPSGFWEITLRPDGARQWAYKGYALYTYAGDEKAGEVNGNNLFDLIKDDNGPYSMADGELGTIRGSPALFWHIAMP